MMQLFELTRALVDIESVTGNESGCAEFLRDYLAERKLEVELVPVPDAGSSGRANVFAVCGAPEVVLSTHLDTVPPFFPAREDSDFIYGRGACDAKGIIASQVAAAERLLGEGARDSGLLFLAPAAPTNAPPTGPPYPDDRVTTNNIISRAPTRTTTT